MANHYFKPCVGGPDWREAWGEPADWCVVCGSRKSSHANPLDSYPANFFKPTSQSEHATWDYDGHYPDEDAERYATARWTAIGHLTDPDSLRECSIFGVRLEVWHLISTEFERLREWFEHRPDRNRLVLMRRVSRLGPSVEFTDPFEMRTVVVERVDVLRYQHYRRAAEDALRRISNLDGYQMDGVGAMYPRGFRSPSWLAWRDEGGR